MGAKGKANQEPEADDSSSESINCCQLNVHKKKIRRQRRDVVSPLKKRSCTDVICLLLFLVFLGAWIALGVYAFISGDPGEIFAPRDSSGKKCGYDEEVSNKPYLVFFDLTKCVVPGGKLLKCDTPEVCVEKCPEENFYASSFEGTSDHYFLESKLICQLGTDLHGKNVDELLKLTKNGTCAEWYLESVSVANRCLPDLSKLIDAANGLIAEIDTPNGKVNATLPVKGDDVNDGSLVVQALTAVTEFGESVARDLMETWPWILVCIIAAMVLSLFYIIIMRWIAGLMIWFSLIACVALLSFSCYFTWTKYDQLRNAELAPQKQAHRLDRAHLLRSNLGDDAIQAMEDKANEFLRMKETWLAFFIISAGVLLILLIVLIFLRNRIRLAIALINEASRAVAHSWSTLFFPIFPWILQIAVMCYGAAICLYLFSAAIYKVTGLQEDIQCVCKSYKDGDICLPEVFAEQCTAQGQACATASCAVAKESGEYIIYLQLYNLFIFFWSLFFVGAVGQMILASSFATYYWTLRKSEIPFFTVAASAWRVIRYHLGTAAFGAFLLAVVSWIRTVIEIADKHLNKYDNQFVKAVKCCLRCFFWCLEKFLKFINKNAYIMCAIHGKNFCVSAKDAFSLLIRNILRVFVLDKVTDFLFFISKLVITGAIGVGSFYLFSQPVINLNDINGNQYESTYSFVPIALVVVSAYLIASMFFSVYSMAVDTLFLCFLEDCDTNDGSAEKPYYMSKRLMSILSKKNQPKADESVPSPSKK